ncbi:MAG: hypothetical protein RLZZ214_1886 [Verrucomicrobiota bacterium]|jgi:hypothetical protein
MPASFSGEPPRGYRPGVPPSGARSPSVLGIHGARTQGLEPATRHDVFHDPRLTQQTAARKEPEAKLPGSWWMTSIIGFMKRVKFFQRWSQQTQTV